MTDKQDLIREIHEYVTTHGGENTATHLLVQAASAIQTQAAELEAVDAGGVQALQPEGGPPGSGGWQHHAETMERERDHWRERARTMEEHQRGTVWYWQGDGNDHPESMVNSLPVVIRADQLRALIAGGAQALSAAPAVPAGWVERWHGSGGKEFWEGWSILNAANREMIAHLGPDVDPDAVRDIVAAHNEALCGECAGTGGRWCPACAGATPPAEQQAAPKAAPGEPAAIKMAGYGGCTGINDYLMSDGTIKTMRPHEVVWREAPQQAAPGDEGKALAALRYYMSECSGAEPSISVFHRMVEEALGAAPQQEAQEPGEIDRLRAALVYTALALHGMPQYRLADGIALIDGDTVQVSRDGWTVQASANPLRQSAHPAPAPLGDDVVRDAARWRWLSEHIGVAWNEGKFTSLVRIVSDKNRAALNASIDRMMTGDWSDAALAAQGGE